MNDTTKSKFLSLVLRHQPDLVGITLDHAGWVAVDELLRACATHGKSITRDELERIVETSEKKRFALSDDGLRIRANQGHSVEVNLEHEERVPPSLLFHGTATRFLTGIRAQGLQRQARHHVHLSAEWETAVAVGQRHGNAVVLAINADAMHKNGHRFFLSPNGVWLTDHVPTQFIQFPAGDM